jgi:hypothetical protein
MGEMIRIRYAEGETGWARDLGEGRYQIANVPLCGGLNIDDVVTTRLGDDGMLAVSAIVERPMDHKRGFRYATEEGFRAIATLGHARGCKIEGMVGPRGDEPGLAQIAYPAEVDPEALAKEAGVAGFELFPDDEED